MGKNRKIKIYTAMFFAVLFWGFSFVWSKQVLAVYKPVTVIYLRLILSVFFLFLFGLLFHKIQKIKKEDRLKIIIIAFFEPFIYFLGENFGLTHVSSTVASVLISTIPLFSLIAAYFFTKERMTGANILGIMLSIARCNYCYLDRIGIPKGKIVKQIHADKIIKAINENSKTIWRPDKTLVSFGCYSDPWDDYSKNYAFFESAWIQSYLVN